MYTPFVEIPLGQVVRFYVSPFQEERLGTVVAIEDTRYNRHYGIALDIDDPEYADAYRQEDELVWVQAGHMVGRQDDAPVYAKFQYMIRRQAEIVA